MGESGVGHSGDPASTISIIYSLSQAWDRGCGRSTLLFEERATGLAELPQGKATPTISSKAGPGHHLGPVCLILALVGSIPFLTPYQLLTPGAKQ